MQAPVHAAAPVHIRTPRRPRATLTATRASGQESNGRRSSSAPMASVAAPDPPGNEGRVSPGLVRATVRVHRRYCLHRFDPCEKQPVARSRLAMPRGPAPLCFWERSSRSRPGLRAWYGIGQHREPRPDSPPSSRRRPCTDDSGSVQLHRLRMEARDRKPAPGEPSRHRCPPRTSQQRRPREVGSVRSGAGTSVVPAVCDGVST